MANIKRANALGITKSGTAISDVPDAPTIGAVTDLGTGASASVAYTAAATGGTATTFTATSSPGGFTGTGSSPITVSGLTAGTSYTFTVTASNSTGTSPASSASSSVTIAAVGKYESIATVTVGSGGASNIEFTSIPATYTHLQIRGITGNVTSGNASSGVYYACNSDTTNGNYKSHALYGDGSSVSPSPSNRALGLIGATSGYNSYVIDILDYKNTNKYKTVRSLSGFDQNGYGFIWFGSSVWMNTNAITTLTFTSDGGNFLQYSTLALYGIKVN